jgi:hypothetical protein
MSDPKDLALHVLFAWIEDHSDLKRSSEESVPDVIFDFDNEAVELYEWAAADGVHPTLSCLQDIMEMFAQPPMTFALFRSLDAKAKWKGTFNKTGTFEFVWSGVAPARSQSMRCRHP